MLDNAKKLISEHVKTGDKIGLAISGGADSMALFSLILSQDFIDKKDIVCININHNIRGKNSDNDTNFVKEFCIKNNVEFKGFSVDVPACVTVSGSTIEQEARNARIEAFNSLINSGVVKCVLTAHHADDNTETILLHLFRGSGLNGLCGMEIMSENKIFRPFLTTTKTEIDEYIKANKIDFVIDESNLDSKYTRNYLRNEILPLVRKKWGNVDSHLQAVSNEAKNVSLFLDSLIGENLFVTKKGSVKIDIAAFEQNSVLLSRIILTAFKKIGIRQDIERRHIQLVMDLKLAKSGTEINLPQGIFALRDYDGVVLTCDQPDKASTTVQDFAMGKIKLDNITILTELYNDNEFDGLNTMLVCDCNKIPKDAVWRFRQEGDIFTPYGGGTKKLKEYFIDKKIPRRLRNSIPLLACDKNILIVGDIEISDLVKITQNSKKISIKVFAEEE